MKVLFLPSLTIQLLIRLLKHTGAKFAQAVYVLQINSFNGLLYN